MKSEPALYSIDDLAAELRTDWPGVRNYQARNLLRDELAVGDLVLFYHSNAAPSGVAGVARVVKAGYPDPTAQDPANAYYDPKATPEDPRWYMVDLEFVARLPEVISLATLKADRKLQGMLAVTGSRLSVQPVSRAHFERVLALAKGEG